LIVREDEAGEELGVVRIDNDPLTLADAVSAAGPNPMVAIEATYGWYWAVDVLEELGAEVHLVHPSGLNWDDRRVKNDYRDCRELLDRMRLGKLPEAWIAPPEIRELRELVRYRWKLVALRTGLKAQVKAVLAKAGLHPPVDDLWGVAGGKYLDEIELGDGATVRVESIRDLVEILDREVVMLERETHRRLKDHPGYRAIQALDGVGPVLAAVFVVEIGDVGRFDSSQALCSWAGLTPKHRESDRKVRRGRVTKAGSPLVRWAAVEAISHMRGGPKLRNDYHRIGARRGVNIARVAVARKLLTPRLLRPARRTDPMRRARRRRRVSRIGHSQHASSWIGMTPTTVAWSRKW
jgi:transposase